MSDALAELFPEGDFRFHLTLRRAEPRQFFAPRDPGGQVLAEREKWISCDPRRYVASSNEADPAVREFSALVGAWGLVKAEVSRDGATEEHLRRLGRAIEPDLLFLTGDAKGVFRLRAGCLCFPTGWALTEKLGLTLDSIHGIVPGLNVALAPAIQQFLSKMKPGAAFLRDNWGIAATDTLNLHPERRIDAPTLPAALDRLWLRVEHQALLALPESRGIVFAIRIALHRLDRVAESTHARGLRRALASMPKAVASYKRIDAILSYLLNVL